MSYSGSSDKRPVSQRNMLADKLTGRLVNHLPIFVSHTLTNALNMKLNLMGYVQILVKLLSFPTFYNYSAEQIHLLREMSKRGNKNYDIV